MEEIQIIVKTKMTLARANSESSIRIVIHIILLRVMHSHLRAPTLNLLTLNNVRVHQSQKIINFYDKGELFSKLLIIFFLFFENNFLLTNKRMELHEFFLKKVNHPIKSLFLFFNSQLKISYFSNYFINFVRTFTLDQLKLRHKLICKYETKFLE